MATPDMTQPASDVASADREESRRREPSDVHAVERTSRYRFLTSCALLLVAIGAVLLPRNGAPISEEAEDRCLDVVEHMTSTGEWLVPMRDGNPRLQKPPLYYWVSTLSSYIAGGATTTSLRWVSALSALVLVLLTIDQARRIGGTTLALTAGVLLGVTHQIYSQGREATAEMLLALLCNGALWSAFWVCRDPSGPTWRIAVFAVCVGLALLTKATAVLLLVGAPILVYLALERRLRAALRPSTLGVLMVTLVPTLAWYVAVLVVVPGAKQALYQVLVLPLGVETTSHSAAHFRSIAYYLTKFPAATIPASLFLPLLIWRGVRSRLYRGEPALRFLAVSLLTIVITFSLVPQKQKHYLLPAVPLLAVLLADALLVAWTVMPERIRLAVRSAGVVVCVAGLALAACFAWFFHAIRDANPWAWAPPIAVVCAALVGAMVFGLRGEPRRFAALMLPAYFAIAHIYYTHVDVWRIEIDSAVDNDRPLPDEGRMVRLSRESPRMLALFNVDDWLEERGLLQNR